VRTSCTKQRSRSHRKPRRNQVPLADQGPRRPHQIKLVAQAGDKTLRFERPLNIIASDARSTRRLGGAWVDLYHHDPAEGKPFDEELGKMTEAEWCELVRAMHEVDQNLLVITMMFQNSPSWPAQD